MTIGSVNIFHDHLPSTNTYAAELLKKDTVYEGTIIRTNFQTAGKGQTGNSWESEEGKNLLISLILFPTMIRPQEQFLISKAISLGICDYLLLHTTNVSIKWPNDIYINSDKIAGILIETSIMGVRIENMIIGIGLNINQKKFNSNAPNPVSLSQKTGKEYDLEECLKELTVHLDNRYTDLLDNKRPRIHSDYLAQLYRYDKWSNYRDSGGSFEGRIVALVDNGMLKIEDRSGRFREYGFREVEFI